MIQIVGRAGAGVPEKLLKPLEKESPPSSKISKKTGEIRSWRMIKEEIDLLMTASIMSQ